MANPDRPQDIPYDVIAACFGIEADSAPDGVLFQASPDATKAALTEGKPAEQGNIQSTDNDGLTRNSAAVQEAPDDASGTVLEAADRFRPEGDAAKGHEPTNGQEDERVRFSGRLGRDLSFSRTGKGMAIARLAVGEHTDDKTVWHRVVAFRDVAEALQQRAETGNLQTGSAVAIVGYKGQEAGPDRKPRTIIRAVGITGIDDANKPLWNVFAKKRPANGAQSQPARK